MDRSEASESYVDGLQGALGTKPIPPMMRKLRGKKGHVAVHEPREELRKLLLQHKALVRASKAAQLMTTHRTVRSDFGPYKKGDVMPCRLPDDARVELQTVAKNMDKRASSLGTSMKAVLRDIPIYQQFLRHVFGIGEGAIIAAYLVGEIDIQRSIKPSGLRRFCGLAVIDGRLERRRAGQKNQYNAEMRMRLFQLFSGMAKNAGKKSKDKPFGTTSKYLEIWKNYKTRMQQSERYDVASNTLREFSDAEAKPRKGAKAVIHATGWHKAADVFIEDLYIVWRALEGLPVWPSYHAAKLGYSHGGKICVDAPKLLTLKEALEVTDGYQGSAAAERLEVEGLEDAAADVEEDDD